MPESIQVQSEDKVLNIVSGMQFTWPPAEQIRARRLPWHKQGDGNTIVHQGITIYPLKKTYAAGTNEREDVGYGVGIAIIAPADHSTRDNRNKVAQVTEAIRRELVEDQFQLDLDNGTYITTKVADMEVNLPIEDHRHEVSGMAIRFWMREPRT